MKRIILLSTSLILLSVLTACNSTVKPECWKATHNTVGKDCNSGGGSVKNPGIKGKLNKKGTTPETPSPDTDEGNHNNNPQAPEDNTNDSNTPPDNTNDNNNPPSNEDNNSNPPNQSNSNDIEGYDPFGGLYGPGT